MEKNETNEKKAERLAGSEKNEIEGLMGCRRFEKKKGNSDWVPYYRFVVVIGFSLVGVGLVLMLSMESVSGVDGIDG